jgi:hypothetical protein
MANGQCGYFDPGNTTPIIEHKNSPSISKATINRKGKCDYTEKWQT